MVGGNSAWRLPKRCCRWAVTACCQHVRGSVSAFSVVADRNYYQCWLGLKSHFDPSWTPESAVAGSPPALDAALGSKQQQQQQEQRQENGQAAAAAGQVTARG